MRVCVCVCVYVRVHVHVGVAVHVHVYTCASGLRLPNLLKKTCITAHFMSAPYSCLPLILVVRRMSADALARWVEVGRLQPPWVHKHPNALVGPCSCP